MPAFLAFLIHLLALAAGMVFTVGMLVVSFVGAALWLLHSGWVRLGGRPVWSFLLARRRGANRAWTEHVRPERRFVPQRVRVPVRDITDVDPK
ncbi:hypothetical protein EZ313_18860 [Ramlibacter henchirensis]|uniref:Uncharacterized protein n=1 Tax=Ramlibacter henchirensis TaxID=204072 RepID=A0A4Z0BNX8_9BURK|nr:hypothetical protein [Ramlibacter henchirensis]TFZ00521.1 hypothetical protein EZ313_18860 [Ramlibacter henchirensis]